MTHRRDQIKLTPEEQRELLQSARTLQFATIGADGQPHLAPMWFNVDDEGRIVFTTYGKSQKVKNLERDARFTALVEAGRDYKEIRGFSIEGQAELIRDPLTTARTMNHVARKYYDVPAESYGADDELPPQAYKRVTVRLDPSRARIRSWDHRKL